MLCSAYTTVKFELASGYLWMEARRAQKSTEILQLVRATAMMNLE
jgi:hypothetical protein